MSRKKALLKSLMRWSRWPIAVLVMAFVLQVGLLAFPQVLLGNHAEAGSVVVFYRGDQDAAVQDMVADADHRLRAGGFGDPGNPERIFFFRDQGLYSLFARLARVPIEAQGFGASILGTTYVSGPRVEALGERTGRAPRYSVWEGSIPHTMAHEVAHLFMVDSIGRSTWKSLPQWKQEGYPEYIANIGLIRADSSAALPRRIDILLDDEQWLGPRSWDRIHYQAALMVEFLLDVQEYDLRAIVSDSTTEESTFQAMMQWYRGAERGDPGG
jgi:hypothetical protein